MPVQVIERKHGLYQSALCKWEKDSVKQFWESAMRFAPQTMEKAVELPNWLRLACNVGTSKGRSADWAIPLALQRVIDSLLSERLSCMDALDGADVEETIRACADAYNKAIAPIVAKVQDHNRSVKAKLLAGTITEQEAENRANTWPPLCYMSSSSKGLERLAGTFMKRFGWSAHRVNCGGCHLLYDDPRQLEVREYVNGAHQKFNIREELVLNFDHVWSMKMLPDKRKCWKDNSEAGVDRDKFNMTKALL